MLNGGLNSDLQADIFLYDANGVQVLVQKQVFNEIELDVSSLPTGVCFLSLTGEKNLIKKVMITR